MEEFEHLLWHSGLTTDARNYVISQIGNQTFTDIAAGLGLCVQTIANIVNEFSEGERAQRLELPYRLRDYEAALDYLTTWESFVLESGLDEMDSILHTVQNWLPYIMNHFVFA